MARNGADVLVKKNSKLEAFLKKNLEDGTFDRVRAYDSCVVCSEKEDKAFKYVVLSDEWIYLTENPPKKIVEVVNLQHVTTVELVNDFPEFLSGEERENTQHIIVKYLTEVPLKTKKKAKNARQKSTKDKSTADAQSGADYGDSLSESMSSRLSSSLSKKKGAQLSPPPKRTHNLLLEKKMGNLKLAGSADEALLKTLLKKNETNQSSKHRSKFNLSSSSPSSQLHPLIGHSNQEVDFKDQLRSRKKRLSSSGNAPLRPLPQLQLPVASSDSDFSTSSESSRESRSTTSNLASTLKNRYSSSKYDRIQELPRALPTPDTPDDFRRQEPSKLSYSHSGDLRLHLGDSEEENENDEEEVNHNKVSKKNANISGRPGKSPRSPRSPGLSVNDGNSKTKDKSKTRRISWQEDFDDDYDEDECDDDDDSYVEDEEKGGSDVPEKREAVLHLYILNYASPMLMLTRSAWNNYLIKGTFLQDPDYEDRTQPLSPRAATSEKLTTLFGQLKREILNPGNRMEDIFSLMNELKMAAEKNMALRKLFWKTPELFSFLISQLQRYLPNSPVNVNCDKGRSHRADEFELVIILTETLSLMFRETEILPWRLQCLTAGQGKAALDLLVLATCYPEIPQKYQAPSSKAAALLNSTQADQWKCLADAEIAKLMVEFTNSATAVLFEMILIAHQANWGDSEGQFFNICWLIKVLEELNTTEKFVERLISQAMRFICPSKREELQPAEAVLVFQQFTVLQTLTEYSPQTTTYIRNNFTEEFKYFIQAPLIVAKLPRNYPLTPFIIKLIEEMWSSVLQKRMSLSAESS